MSRVLVVDDDPGLRTVLRDALSRDGHEVTTAADGAQALQRLAEDSFDLVITDLSMPGMDGAGLVREIRGERSDAPILVLTVRQEEREKVALLDAGADDYVVKPFGVAELLARVRALLRRKAPPATTVLAGELTIDLDLRRVRRGSREIHLTPTEFDLLRTLLSKPGAVWTHRQLVAAVWGGGEGVTSDTVRVHVGSLRRKIEEDPDRPRLLRTEPWVGYRFVVPE
jgi:two-component system KDP operon response regulator KdpE